MKFEFKKLELEPEGNWFSRLIKSPQFRRSIISILIGAVAGFVIYYMNQDGNIPSVFNKESIHNILFGAGFGFFITNSPCARGRC